MPYAVFGHDQFHAIGMAVLALQIGFLRTNLSFP